MFSQRTYQSPLLNRVLAAGSTTAKIGELIRVTATTGVTVTAPGNLRDGDHFGVVYDVQAFNVPKMIIDGNGGDFAALGAGEDQWFLLPGGYADFVWSESDGLWHHQAASKVPKVARPASSFSVRGNTTDATITPAVVWEASRNNIGIRWHALVSAADHTADEVAQYLIDATFYRQNTGVVVEKHVVYVNSPQKDPGLVNLDVDFIIAAANITMRVKGDVGITIDWDIEGEVWEF